MYLEHLGFDHGEAQAAARQRHDGFQQLLQADAQQLNLDVASIQVLQGFPECAAALRAFGGSSLPHLHEGGVLHYALVVAVAGDDVEKARQPLLLYQESLLQKVL